MGSLNRSGLVSNPMACTRTSESLQWYFLSSTALLHVHITKGLFARAVS